MLSWSWKITGRVLSLQQPMRILHQHYATMSVIHADDFIKLADKKWPPI